MLRELARTWLDRGQAAAVVSVEHTQGSAPREAGTRMLVSACEVAGTIGGGHLEFEAIRLAREALAHPGWTAFTQRFPLGPRLGQCCGGVVELRIAPLDEAAWRQWPETPPRFVLQLYGAGHVGRALVRVLETLPCQVQWIDEREDAFPPDIPLSTAACIERLCVDSVEAEVARAPANACFLVMTHQHDLDLRITEAILRRGDFRYFGLIGSKTKRSRFEHRLIQRGIAPQALARMRCPIGVPGIEGKSPEVIAVAVAAELLQATSTVGAPPLCSPPPFAG
ncbi:MAG: xanthine dehydrogenase accessory protein XdhC [Caldimonas manganoxidans]|nr:xanthine dehydrogenase accessory protein XdhC [Caldimonas manganoxidans]